MNKNSIEVQIKNKALELGYHSCGIIKTDAVKEYAAKLEERIACFPASKPLYEPFHKYAFPQKNYEWAKSIVVCITRYGKYKIPEQIDNLIGKYYLYDYKLQNYSKEYASNVLFEAYLHDLGLKTAKELHGITSGRWAAFKAGLGVIRKNNFLYTKHGSWVLIDTWLIDREMELIEKPDLPACPESCTKCIDTCPTCALSEPYCTDMGTCITRLTWGMKDLVPEDLRDKMGKRIYGCDECQNVCPMNKNTWHEAEEYPQLNELAEHITLERILSMDEKTFEQVFLPKFWFIRPETSWMWKTNALRAMVNSYQLKYEKYIREACNDNHEKVREMAVWVCARLGI